MAMGGIARSTARETAVDFSYPSFTTKIDFVTKKPQPLPKFHAVWWPFNNDLWISVFMSLVLFSMGYWCFSKLDKEGFSQDSNFGKYLAQALRIFMMQGKQNKQEGNVLRNLRPSMFQMLMGKIHHSLVQISMMS